MLTASSLKVYNKELTQVKEHLNVIYPVCAVAIRPQTSTRFKYRITQNNTMNINYI